MPALQIGFPTNTLQSTDLTRLNEGGSQATTFAFEENFRFSFSIINNMDEDLFISEMYDMENFFEVFIGTCFAFLHVF